MGEGRRKRRRRVEPTDDWKQLKLLFGWPEQVRYEELRPLVLFGSSVAERAIEIEAAERTLYRRMDRFETEEMESLFDSETARHRKLLPTIRRLIVDLKAEHPRLSLGEIASICYVGFGRRPSKHTVKRILEEEPMPLKMVRRFDPYHEIEEPMERRMAVVRLHSEGWAPKSIAGYLGMHKSTVYRVLKRWIEEGEQGLEDKPHGRPSGVRKVDLKAIEAIRRLQQNPHLGAFRVHAALAQMGIHLSPATCGRILALNRRLYGLDKPRGPSQEKREMPFASSRRHEYWTTDVRYVEHRLGGNIYVQIRFWRTTAGRSSQVGSFAARISRLTSLSFTRRWSATALPKPSSPTAGPSSGPTRHSRSTKP
jgi:putative transposase